MKFLPMYMNTRGMPDLVYHTVRHFFSDSERAAWDRLTVGSLTARDAWAAVCRVEGVRPPRGRFPAVGWWDPLWIEHVRRAHDEGYQPRYEWLAASGGHPSGGAWQPANGRNRCMLERGGFRIVVQRSGENYQVITAYHAGLSDAHAESPGLAAAAPLHAFEQRRQSLISRPNGVYPPKRTP